MTDFGVALLNILTNDVGVSALVGARIYRQSLLQEVTLPAITYQLVSGVPIPDHDGASTDFRQRYQIDCWAMDADVAASLLEAVRSAVDFKPAGTYGGVTMIGLQYDSEQNDFYESEREVFRRTADVTMWAQT